MYRLVLLIVQNLMTKMTMVRIIAVSFMVFSNDNNLYSIFFNLFTIGMEELEKIGKKERIGLKDWEAEENVTEYVLCCLKLVSLREKKNI